MFSWLGSVILLRLFELGVGFGVGVPKATVMVMRHCARATPSTIAGGDPSYLNASDYSSREMPDW